MRCGLTVRGGGSFNPLTMSRRSPSHRKRRASPQRTPSRKSAAAPAHAALPTSAAAATALPPISCIVVLMLENRSFDHLFGKWPGTAGLSQGPFANRVNPAKPAGAGNEPIAEGQPALFSVAQGQGPGHSVDATNVQLFGTQVIAPGATLKAADERGFVESYKTELATDGFGGPSVDLSAVMQTFVAGQLPALSALAQNFVLCDQWFCEVPGPTMPNRLYIHAATSAGWARNDWSVDLDSVTIYEQIAGSGRSWSVYYSDQNEVAQYTRINAERANFKLYESSFAADAAAGKLASYNFIIPRFAASASDGPVTSMHAPQDVRPGDRLVADIYAALRAGPQWGVSLLIVTFDEHGGYFDHADPPAAANPDGIDSPAPGDTASFAPAFGFDRLGLRVPTLLASPYLPKGTVSSQLLQHTSVLVTARKLFGIAAPLTRRDAAAASFENLFLATPRSDAPPTLVAPGVETLPSAASAAPDDYMREMAIGWRRRTGGLAGAAASVPTPTSQQEVHDFLRSQVQLFLDHRGAPARRKTRARTRH